MNVQHVSTFIYPLVNNLRSFCRCYIWGLNKSTQAITTEIIVNGTPITMKVDTGAAVSTMSSQQKLKLFPEARIQPSDAPT